MIWIDINIDTMAIKQHDGFPASYVTLNKLSTKVQKQFLVEDYALVTHVLLINIYSLATANHSATNVNAL